MRSTSRSTLIAAAAAITLTLVGCSSDDAPQGVTEQQVTVLSVDPAAVADSALTDPAQYATNGTIPEDPGFVQVDANTATTAQLVATFQANGIADPQTWAAQVISHRPYRVVDQFGSEFDGLRASLAAAGLDDLAAGAIVASLTVG